MRLKSKDPCLLLSGILIFAACQFGRLVRALADDGVGFIGSGFEYLGKDRQNYIHYPSHLWQYSASSHIQRERLIKYTQQKQHHEVHHRTFIQSVSTLAAFLFRCCSDWTLFSKGIFYLSNYRERNRSPWRLAAEADIKVPLCSESGALRSSLL